MMELEDWADREIAREAEMERRRIERRHQAREVARQVVVACAAVVALIALLALARGWVRRMEQTFEGRLGSSAAVRASRAAVAEGTFAAFCEKANRVVFNY